MKSNPVRRLAPALALAAALLSGRTAAAQVFTPSFMGPASSGDVGVYVSDAGPGTAIEGIWRQRSRSYDIGLRGGFVDAGSGALSLGAELRNPLHLQTEPVALAFTAGAQALIGDGTALGFQAGLSAGHTFVPGTFTVSPYLHPRIAVARSLGGGDSFDAAVLADLGVDLGFQPNLSLRLSLGLSDSSPDWGIGLAFRR